MKKESKTPRKLMKLVEDLDDFDLLGLKYVVLAEISKRNI